MSSVGVTPGSIFRSRGLLLSDEGATVEGTDRDCSRPAGYERGSARRMREREEDEEAMDGAMSLLTDAVEKVEAIDRRERHDEAEEEVALEVEVDVDMKEEAVELRPRAGGQHGGGGWGWEENQRTRVHCLGEHALDHVRGMACEEGLDVLHRLLWDVVVVVHGGQCCDGAVPQGRARNRRSAGGGGGGAGRVPGGFSWNGGCAGLL